LKYYEIKHKRIEVRNEIGHMLRTCCTSNLHDVSWEGSRRQGGMVGRVFSLFLSGFPRGWIFKGSGLNLRLGIRGQTRIAKQPISVLFLSSPSSLCYNKPRGGGEEKGVGRKSKVDERWKARTRETRARGRIPFCLYGAFVPGLRTHIHCAPPWLRISLI